jgi:hypothetical protein
MTAAVELSAATVPLEHPPGYWLGKTLGSGSYGVVHLGRRLSDGSEVAVKSVKLQRLRPDQLCHVHDEVKIMRELNHPHIIELLDCIETPSELHLVVPFASTTPPEVEKPAASTVILKKLFDMVSSAPAIAFRMMDLMLADRLVHGGRAAVTVGISSERCGGAVAGAGAL